MRNTSPATPASSIDYIDLIRAFQETGSEAAFKELIQSHRRFLYGQVMPFKKHVASSSYDELFEIAKVGFWKSLKNFDEAQGVQLRTYASWTVRKELQDFVEASYGPFHLPKSNDVRRTFYRFSHIQGVLKEEASIRPQSETFHELAGQFNISPTVLQNIYNQMSASLVPVDASYGSGEDDGQKNAERIGGNAPSFEELIADHDDMMVKGEALRQALNKLDPRTQFILRARFMYGEGEQPTLKEVGQRLAISGERARQLEARGMEELIHYTRLFAARRGIRPV